MNLKKIAKSIILDILMPFASLYYKSRIREARLQKNQVLFVANNELMFQHIDLFWSAYHRKEEYKVHLCSTETITMRFSKRRTLGRLKKLAKLKRMDFCPDFVAEKIEWDLLITAEPDVPENLCRASKKCILMQHALVGIKTIDGWLYPYHPERCFLKNGTCKFDAILENTTQALYKVVAQDSRYKDVVQLAGSILADTLLDLNNQREKIREDMGYANDDYVVLVQSTFKESLIEDLGIRLLDECKRIAEEKNLKFIISLHPNHWRGEYSVKHPWGKRALMFESANIKIRRPEEDANLSLIACDIAVTDHTSLAYNYMLLNKPALFYLPPQGNQVMDVMGELVECCATLDRAEPLEEKLQEASQSFDRDRASKIITRLFPYLGKARERNNEILDEILKKH